ncbi:putative sterigmatocystin biosynthesis P450 monooxygenase [Lachnellula arida]|uniref:Putative sterigmatocystin biosynthesis P450 monooxygenase n=1 Tax=Lachnellula arida TaxID=1316785 RepID=A0A8T9BDX0_9HELO|nr:putative sterigmatocystin biosynthesis P450 monooxygenase [Lachnellula arida]
MLSLPILGLATCLLPLSLKLHQAITSPLSKIPGPRYTILTPIFLMLQEFTSKRRLYIHRLHQKYGPVVRLGPNEVSFTSLEALKEIYASGGSGYDRTEFYTLFMQFGVSQKKRYIAGQYANTNIMRPSVVGGVQERAAAFVMKCAESGRESLDVYVYLHCYALDCATHHLFHPYGTHSIEREEDLEMMQELSYYPTVKSNFAQYYWPTLSELFSKPRPSPLANNYVLSTAQKADPAPQTLLYELQNSKDYFEQTEIAAECMDHLAAGIDTTGDALCFLLYQLSLPSSAPIQERLFRELSQNQDTPLDELLYLDAVIKEGLRCFPVIPMSQPRYVPSGGRDIDGYFVPGGTVVSCQAWSVHRLNENVYPNGAEFLPERWLEPQASLEMNKLFFAFGAGGRGCIGRHLAMAEMRCLLKGVYSRFKTSIAPDMKGRMTLSDQVVSSRPLDQTCKLIFEARNEA